MPVLSGVDNYAPQSGTVVAGGRRNVAIGNNTAVTGGERNIAFISNSTIGGGSRNSARSYNATVGGGSRNTADYKATVGGGDSNTASGFGAAIGGGYLNTASGLYATVPGGANNTASGQLSFAAGNLARTESQAGTVHDGAVLFADATSTEFRSQGPNQFRSQMPMFAPSFNSTSARAKKRGITSVNPGTVLDAVTDLEVSTWEFEETDDGRHIGPMAEDFHEAFGVGDNDGTIATIDADGVSLAAIQGLAHQAEEKDEGIEALEADKDALEQAVAGLQQKTETLHEENERLREQYTELEARLAALEDQ